MLINTLPIIDYKEIRSKITAFNSTFGLCIRFNEIQDQEIIKTFLEIKTSHFICIDFRNEKSIDNERLLDNIRSLVLLCFNIHYFKIDNNPVIAVLTNNDNQETNNLINEFKQEFLKQGYEKLLLYILNDNNKNVIDNPDYLYITIDFGEKEKKSLFNLYLKDSITYKLFFVYSSIDKVILIAESINQTEIAFANSEKDRYSNLQLIQQLRSQNLALSNENKSLRTKLQNAEINTNLLRKDADNIIKWYKEEVEKIKDWYHHQYEILPLWYMRIGHIIKRFIKKNDRVKQ